MDLNSDVLSDRFTRTPNINNNKYKGAGITKDSSVGAMRKCYLKLSLVLHPDKNRDFAEATKV